MFKAKEANIMDLDISKLSCIAQVVKFNYIGT